MTVESFATTFFEYAIDEREESFTVEDTEIALDKMGFDLTEVKAAFSDSGAAGEELLRQQSQSPDSQ